ncbi:hypothetical protein ACLQ2S_09315 [Micromonospora sp. DT48]|uniref:hypothetical protein n=1 Tax=unclassified Micromonospora TaxID=2617518 RepID=UPI0012BB81D3|nr:hypothetical protein [Micromonospora sp. CP22]
MPEHLAARRPSHRGSLAVGGTAVLVDFGLDGAAGGGAAPLPENLATAIRGAKKPT